MLRDAVTVEGNGGCQDDKEHHDVREKRPDADINVPKLKFLECCSSPLSKRTLTCRLLFFNFFTRLPEKQVRTDRSAKNRHEHRPFISRMWHRRHQSVAQHSAPIGPCHKRSDRVGKQHQHQPFQPARDLVILKPDRCPRDQECERHHEKVRFDPEQHFSCIGHAGEVRRDVDRVGHKQGHDEDVQQPSWKSLPEIPGQALPRHLADSGTHHLNRGHQRPRQERSPEKLGSKLCARNRISRNAGWVIVGSPGDDARAKRLQQQSHPSNWGEFRHERVGV
jgi:hypothetical protein